MPVFRMYLSSNGFTYSLTERVCSSKFGPYNHNNLFFEQKLFFTKRKIIIEMYLFTEKNMKKSPRKVKMWQNSKTNFFIKLKNSKYYRTQKLQLWQNSECDKTQNLYKNLKLKIWKLKNKNVTKHRNLKFYKIKKKEMWPISKTKIWQHSKSQNMIKLKNYKCDKTQNVT